MVRPSKPANTSYETAPHTMENAGATGLARRRKGGGGTLDDPICVPNDDVEGREEMEDEQVNGVERFFDYLSH